MQQTVMAGFPLLFILSPKELVLDTHLKGTVDGLSCVHGPSWEQSS